MEQYIDDIINDILENSDNFSKIDFESPELKQSFIDKMIILYYFIDPEWDQSIDEDGIENDDLAENVYNILTDIIKAHGLQRTIVNYNIHWIPISNDEGQYIKNRGRYIITINSNDLEFIDIQIKYRNDKSVPVIV